MTTDDSNDISPSRAMYHIARAEALEPDMGRIFERLLKLSASPLPGDAARATVPLALQTREAAFQLSAACAQSATPASPSPSPRCE